MKSLDFSPAAVCLDANVAIACLSPTEKHHQESKALFRILRKKEWIMLEPEVFLFECNTALHRKMLRAELEERDILELLDILYDWPVHFCWDQEISSRMMELARRLSFRGLADCAYVTIAEMKKVPLVTLDEEVLKKAKTIYERVYSPGEFLKCPEFLDPT